MPTRIPIWTLNVSAAATVLGLWLFTQPYLGLRHDAVLYLAQSLRSERPAQFANDLFFAFGSQDSFSAYSLIFGPLFTRTEVWPWQILIVGLSHVAVLAAMWQLLPAGGRPQERWLGMASLALLQLGYGGLSVFAVCEPFLTARTLAEPLSLWALALGWRERHWLAWGLILLAATLHPLMALPAAVCLWLMGCMRDHRWLWLLALIVPIGALVMLQVRPFDGLLRSYPNAWWQLVNEVSAQVLVENWLPEDWAIIAVDVAVLWGAARMLYRGSPPLLLPMLSGCLTLVMVSLFGSQLLHNQLLTQLQLWRSLWIMHVMALSCLPALLLAISRTGASGMAFAASFACLAGIANLHNSSAWLMAVWTLAHACLWLKGQAANRFTWQASIATSTLILLGVGTLTFFSLSNISADDANYVDYSKAGIALIALGIPALGLLGCLWRCQFKSPTGPAGYVGMAFALLLLVGGLAQWDRRAPLVRYMESHFHDKHAFEALVPEGAMVYWDNSLAAAWFLLKRPSYYAKQQGAGLLFNEATAMKFKERQAAFKPLIERRRACELFSRLLGKLPTDTLHCQELAEDELTAICRLAPNLDFAVSGQGFKRAPLAVWEVPGASGPEQIQHLYACQSFR